MSAESHAQLRPSTEVVRSCDGAAAALALADTPELREGSRARNGGSVGSCSGVDIVCSAVAGHLALVGSASRRVVRAVRLDDVVLDQGRGSPTVD